MTRDELVTKVFAELRRAEEKFPGFPSDPLHALAIVQEEMGETTKAVLQHIYEPSKSNGDDVEKEAIQMAAMALRFVLHLDYYKFTECEQTRTP